MDETPSSTGSKSVVIAIIIIVIVLGIGIVYKLSRHSVQIASNYRSTQATTAPSPTPSQTDSTATTDAALDKQAADIQSSMNKLDGDMTSTNQAFSNQSADNPQ